MTRGFPPPPSRTKWTRLVPLPVLIGHVSRARQERGDPEAAAALLREALAAAPHSEALLVRAIRIEVRPPSPPPPPPKPGGPPSASARRITPYPHHGRL